MSVKITGLKALQLQLKEMPKVAKKQVFEAYQDFAFATEIEAKQLAPTDEGALRNAIKGRAFMKDGLVVAELTVNVPYAAYVEFGTRKFAAEYVSSLPQDWKTFAAEFKGKGAGDFYDFLNNILDWVMRKGIANRYSVKTRKKIDIKIGGKGKKSIDDQQRLEETAYAIALSIMRNGIKAQPYLYPAVTNQMEKLKDNLNNIKLA